MSKKNAAGGDDDGDRDGDGDEDGDENGGENGDDDDGDDGDDDGDDDSLSRLILQMQVTSSHIPTTMDTNGAPRQWVTDPPRQRAVTTRNSATTDSPPTVITVHDLINAYFASWRWNTFNRDGGMLHEAFSQLREPLLSITVQVAFSEFRFHPGGTGGTDSSCICGEVLSD